MDQSQTNDDPKPGIRKRLVAMIVAGVGIVIAATIYAAVNYVFAGVTAPAGVSVSVATNVDHISLGRGLMAGEGSAYWFASTPSQLPVPPEELNTCFGRYEWARKLGGIDAGRTLIGVTVAADGSKPVDITGFQVRVLSRDAPSNKGVVASCPGLGEGGPSAVDLVIAELDDNPVSITSHPVGSSAPDPTFAFTLAPGESQVIDVLAKSDDCYCTWEGVLQATIGGHAEELHVAADGRPFVTTALSGDIAQFERHRWIGEHEL